MELSRRQIELFLHLIQDRKPKYGSELAETFSVTDRTVRNDIQVINQELAGYGIYISASRKDGYYISGDCLSRIREKKIIQEIAEQFDFDMPETQNERMVYLLFNMLFDSHYSQEDIEDLFYLSPSVVYSDLRMMEKWLKSERFGLELKKKNGFYYIDEEEPVIRSTISGTYTQRSNMVLELKYSYFISGSIEFWEQTYQLISPVLTFLSGENIKLTGRSILSFCIDIALSYYRTSRGLCIKTDGELSEIGKRLKTALIDYDAKFMALNNSDYIYLMERLAGKDYLNSNPFLTVSERTRELVSAFSQRISQLGEILVSPADVCNEIETLLYIKKHRYYYSVNGKRDIFRNNLESLYLAVLLSYYMHMFYPEIRLNKHDMARLTVCLSNSISSLKKRLLLVCDSSRYTVNIIKEIIERRFSKKAVIDKVATQYDYQEYKHGVEGIITTTLIDETEIPCIEVDINAIDDYIHDIDLFLDALRGSDVIVCKEKTKEKEMEPLLRSLLEDLRQRKLVTSTDFDYLMKNILASSIFCVKQNTLLIMIPMLCAEQFRQFNIRQKGIYNGKDYSQISLLVFSNDISRISMIY